MERIGCRWLIVGVVAAALLCASGTPPAQAHGSAIHVVQQNASLHEVVVAFRPRRPGVRVFQRYRRSGLRTLWSALDRTVDRERRSVSATSTSVGLLRGQVRRHTGRYRSEVQLGRLVHCQSERHQQP